MLVVNLFGQPGAGKSTGAAYIFSQLKMLNINCELVTEFAKDKVWEESKEVFNNQAYIFGKQYFRISRLNNKVEVIITDSPIILSAFYNDGKKPLGKEFDRLTFKVYSSYDNLNVFLHRKKPYNPNGRFQTESESDKISDQLKKFLDLHFVDYIEQDGDIAGYNNIVCDIMDRLGKGEDK